MANVHKFSDFAKDECGLSGEKIAIAEILNKEVIVKAYRIIKSKAIQGKECLQLQIEFNSIDRVTFTNSLILIRQSQEYADKMPFIATIIKNGSYYTFS